ncbi:Iron import ATP-binding/permease IrtA [Gossypium arboreum]|uniref:Phosphorylated adapter RNA export protein n=2 Tax=Gossypium arboreum TaxID=29729 RepID=A0A0B0NVP1_GOSAR|nr:uncharacterized protein LOC108457449 isoform X1 [Gossypium arboreum]KAK5830098.1 hypothetical protein PVK06_013892 [Gossypium arboreum]KHG16707.1 Iron import ATP-binding/permease IrtA [Gossypium arboreum]KHG17936.1 Iron import ATP-binding/permease IrtA [Gossypium arboreum]
MEKGESILEAIYEEDDLGDVEMLDVEEGELVDSNSVNDPDKRGFADVNGENQGSQSKNKKRGGNKKKNKKKKSGSGPKPLDINRFVLDTCRRLKEKKSYMVYTAVGCLGISALSDLVKEIPFATSNPVPLAEMTDFISCLLIEVDAIQSCGGQMTADGRRCRTGGGILWNIIKAREPAAYREIMKKAKEFEKQFKQQNVRQAPAQSKEISSQETTLSNGTAASVPQGAGLIPNDPTEEFSAEGARKSVHDRIRVPVSYEDLLGEDSKDD